MIRQAIHDELLKRLKEKRRFLQVLAGPRQAGKTTLVRQVMAASKMPAHYASADEPTVRSDRTWLERNQEVDFVLQQGKSIVAIEVKSGGHRESLPGMEAFARQFKPKRKLLVGGQGIALEEFLSKPTAHWLT